MATVLITGGSGLIGTHLTQLLLAEGFQVRHLSRTPRPGAPVPQFAWDLARGTMDPAVLQGVDHVIHLSGANIAQKRWTAGRMGELYASRSGAADLLRKTVEQTGAFPKSFISASGINYYGAVTTQHVFTESNPPGNDAIGRLTQAWEAAADTWAPHCRVVKLRTPIVLAREGGALPKLATPARWGLAAPLGSGTQWIPWVHIADITHAYLHALRHADMHGAYNVVAPEQPTNRAFTRALAKALHRPAFLPAVPKFLLRAALGELSSLVLEGARASNAKLVGTGFAFRYARLEEALGQLFK